MRLIQLSGPAGRRIGVVDEARVSLLKTQTSVYALAAAALAAGISLERAAGDDLSTETVDYDGVYRGASEWRILPSIDHPLDPARCMVSGTGLTHIRSAANRQAMHEATAQVTDSMRMYQWGVEGGRPESGRIGTAPEWFYKGNGTALRAHNEPLEIPSYAEDGGEESEAAGVYIIGQSGTPRRIGMTAGNEFSDHVFEKRNYLYLAASKLRQCAIGPELVLNPEFDLVRGEAAVERAGEVIWSKPIQTGESVMAHSLANLEHHHFKFEAHRRPGDLHVHFFGADAFSFGEGIRLADGDVMRVGFERFGRPLRNPVKIAGGPDRLVVVRPV
jgi:hypothetical protein